MRQKRASLRLLARSNISGNTSNRTPQPNRTTSRVRTSTRTTRGRISESTPSSIPRNRTSTPRSTRGRRPDLNTPATPRNRNPISSNNPLPISLRASPRLISRGVSRLNFTKPRDQVEREKKEALLRVVFAAMGDGNFMEPFTEKDVIYDSNKSSQKELNSTGIHYIQIGDGGHFYAIRYKNPNTTPNTTPTANNSELLNSYKKGWQRQATNAFCQTFAIMAYMRKEKELENVKARTQGMMSNDSRYIECSKIAFRYVLSDTISILIEDGILAYHVNDLKLQCYLKAFQTKPTNKQQVKNQVGEFRRLGYELINDRVFPDILFGESYEECT